MPSHQHPRSTATDPQISGQAPTLKIKTHLKAGGTYNHNETLVQAPRPEASLRVRTRIKTGAYPPGPARS